MLADEPTLTPGLYRLPEDPVGPRVLIPGFKSATSVRGAFGWFSAGWIARLAPGLAVYLARTDTLPIDFTVAPVLFSAERTALERGCTMSAEDAARRIASVFTDGRPHASALGRHALDCLSWMLAADRLRIRIAVPSAGSNYHPKIWLFDDGAHRVVARGSGNATARGVSTGVEHLDVDVSWIDHSRKRVNIGVSMLNDWACGRSTGIARVVDLPEALKRDIVHTAPDVPPDQSDYTHAVTDDMTPPWTTDPVETLRARFAAPRSTSGVPRLQIPGWLEWHTGPYAHQGEAVDAWEGSPDPERGTLAMATGSGKTLVALLCATRAQDRLGHKPFLVVVSAPSIPLVIQWRAAVGQFGLRATAPSLESNTDVALTNLLRGLGAGGTHVLIVTNDLLCSPAFQSTVAARAARPRPPIATMLVGDEAHTLGANGFIACTPDFFERRLALSATPERQYDPDGTEGIFEFFGPPVYEFGLERAIGLCLTPYDYHVHAATLDGDELEEFSALTGRIGALMGQDPPTDDDALTKLLIARRRVVETARAKISLLKEVLKRRRPSTLTHTLIYASAKDPESFDDIAKILTDLDVRWAPVTQVETARTKLLARTLSTFANGGYQVLLAKRVLDEGIDIPSVREAFIVASSTVQREWIQRRGRVLRRHPGKPWAIVHDFIALPPARLVAVEGARTMRKLVRSELDRAYSFAAHARNATGVDGVLAVLERIQDVYWPAGDSGFLLQEPGDYVVAPTTPEGIPW